jgi:polyisoprenoid-binding protein YceI
MKKKTKIGLGIAAAVVVVLGATAAFAGPAFYRDVIVGEPDAAPTASLTPGSSTLDPSQLTGDWNIGDGSTAGYRVDEVLNGTDVTVVGKTDQVSGTITVDGTTISAATIDVDVASIATDSSNRDDYFTLTQPIEAAVPSDGEVAKVEATGELTMHGVTKTVTVPLQAALSGDGVQVSGSIPVTFSDYGVDAPSLGFVKVEDKGTVEFLVAATPAS